MKLPLSYSAVKNFENCPRQFYETRILKRFKSQPTEATMYGERVHKAFEEFVRDGKPLPAAFEAYRQFVEPLATADADIHCEEKMGITADFKPCGFFDKNVWCRGLPDYLAISRSGKVARIADYKTGKSSRYADPAQLELMAAMAFIHYPTVERIKGALLFVVVGDIIKAEYTREQLPEILSKWAGRASAIERAVELNVWNPRSSALCKFCPLTEDACEHR